MITTIKLDNINNFIIDKKSGEFIERYDPDNKDVELHIALPESTLIVDGNNIIQEYGGNIVVQHNDDKYIIDDGYGNILIKAGYIVYKNYDTIHEVDPEKGKSMRSMIIDSIRALLPEISTKYNAEGTCIPSTMFCDRLATRMMIGGEDDHFKYTVKFNTINSIVNKNNIRKVNSLSFYPFDKSMDRYGTIYLSIFSQKNYKEKNDPDKYSITDNIIRDIISNLGPEYHYVSMNIKSRVLYWNGI